MYVSAPTLTPRSDRRARPPSTPRAYPTPPRPAGPPTAGRAPFWDPLKTRLIGPRPAATIRDGAAPMVLL